jgi:hypothetical protein
VRLARVPIKWNHLIDKDAAQNRGVGSIAESKKASNFFKDMPYPWRLSPLAVEHLAPQIAFQDYLSCLIMLAKVKTKRRMVFSRTGLA